MKYTVTYSFLNVKQEIEADGLFALGKLLEELADKPEVDNESVIISTN